jgi:hypothetical protein
MGPGPGQSRVVNLVESGFFWAVRPPDRGLAKVSRTNDWIYAELQSYSSCLEMEKHSQDREEDPKPEEEKTTSAIKTIL